MEGEKVMNKEELLNRLTVEDVTQLMMEFGSPSPIPDQQGHLYFSTSVCHGGSSQKLCFYPDSFTFFCYTDCNCAYSLFDLIMKLFDFTFKEAFLWLCQWKGFNPHDAPVLGFKQTVEKNEDFDFLNQHLTTKSTDKQIQLTIYDSSVLNIFHPLYSSEWQEEGITPQTAEVFDLRFCFHRNATIIPYLNEAGELIGIRQRNHTKEEIEAGRKYIPATIEGLNYRYPSSQVFYGTYEHQQAIKQYRQVVLFEGEKSTLLHHSFYQNHSTALSIGGSNLSLQHRQILLKMGVEEVTICMDKQYQLEHYEEVGTSAYREYISHIKKLKKMVGLLVNYMTVHVVLCFDDRLQYKDSPIDRGQAIFEQLMSERVTVYSAEDLDELLF